MQAVALVCLLALAGQAAACAHSYTHSRGLMAEPEACLYNHVDAGMDWPAKDAECHWTCGGFKQSPINVPARVHRELDRRLRANTDFGVATKLRVLNLGHAIQVEFDSPLNNHASVPVCNNSIYGLYSLRNPNKECRWPKRAALEPLQFHFHATSEHLLAGRSTQLELHIVTKLTNATGFLPQECQGEKPCLAVFGVLYDLTMDPYAVKGDERIQRIIEALPKDCPEAGRTCASPMAGVLNLSELLPKTWEKNNWNKDTKYSTYTGSLTTPPCTEGVMWHVFGNVKATLTYQQVIELQTAVSTATAHGHEVENRLNNRVTLPLAGRTVYGA